jgi:hypothetical protein
MKRIALVLYILLNFIQLNAQQRTIKGIVYNIGGDIISGAKVYAKEAPSIFTLTDAEGKYQLEIPAEVNLIAYSYTGMTDKIIKLKEFNSINVYLIPSSYKKFRWGLGVTTGVSNFKVFNLNFDPNYPDTISIKLIPLAINADIYFRLSKRIEIQGVLSDGLNFSKIEKDSINSSGDTIHYTDHIVLNRFSFSIPVNFHFNLSKTGNYSVFFGLGPLYQHISYLNLNAIGARFQAGVNVNNYGITTRFNIAVDVCSGKFGSNNDYIPGFPYKYVSGRIGTVFIF